MTFTTQPRVFVRAAALVTLFACSSSTSPDKSGTFFGPNTPIGGGTGRAYITLDRAGVPTDLGLALTDAVMPGLPAANAEFVFTLPSQASVTPFKHAVINWMPTGHPPPMIYTVPHFDFHFYTITNAERTAILVGDPTLDAKMARQPAVQFVPAGYIIGMPSAQMGLHWNDPDSPERHGEVFTKTFIYGSYDGTFIFAEPMVTKAYLETRPSVVTTVKLPAQYATHGYQPTSYTISYDNAAKEQRIALSGLVMR